MLSQLTPGALQDVQDIIDKLNKFMSNENTKLVHDLAEDADSSVKSINKLFHMFGSVKKSKL